MCGRECILLHRKAELIKEFQKLSACYTRLVSVFDEAHTLGEEQANFALAKLIEESTSTFLELQQVAHDLEYALYSLPEPEIRPKVFINH